MRAVTIMDRSMSCGGSTITADSPTGSREDSPRHNPLRKAPARRRRRRRLAPQARSEMIWPIKGPLRPPLIGHTSAKLCRRKLVALERCVAVYVSACAGIVPKPYTKSSTRYAHSQKQPTYRCFSTQRIRRCNIHIQCTTLPSVHQLPNETRHRETCRLSEFIAHSPTQHPGTRTLNLTGSLAHTLIH